jgi:hypothetical protein
MASTRFRTTKRAGAVALALAAGSTGVIAATTGSASAASLNWDKVAACESGGNWGISTGNGYSGGLQFSPSTWHAYGGSGDASSASKSAQIAVAERVLAAQGPGAWPVCSQGASGGSTYNTTQSSRASRSTSRQAVTQQTHRTVTQHSASTPTRTYTSYSSLVLSEALESQVRADVKLAQQRLNKHGAHLAVDGQFGPLTKAATQKFQAEHGLAADGEIGSVTQRALRH